MKLIYAIPVIVFILLGVGLAVSLQQPHQTVQSSPLIGKKLPEFSLPSVFAHQPPVTSSQFSGKMVLVNVFASWCMTCLIEHPMLTKLTKETGLPIIGIAWKDKGEHIRQWLEKHGSPYAAVGADRDGRIAIDLGVTGAPESFLVNAQGIVIYRFAGALTEEIIRDEVMPRIK